jgi:hypothetical protein
MAKHRMQRFMRDKVVFARVEMPKRAGGKQTSEPVCLVRAIGKGNGACRRTLEKVFGNRLCP